MPININLTKDDLIAINRGVQWIKEDLLKHPLIRKAGHWGQIGPPKYAALHRLTEKELIELYNLTK